MVLVLMDATRRVQLEEAGGTCRMVMQRDPWSPTARDRGTRFYCEAQQRRTGAPGSVVMSASNAPKHERTNWASEDEFLFGLIRKIDCPVFLVLTKIDLVPKDRLLPLIDALTRQYKFAEIIPVSARKRDGLDLLVREDY